jgi:hypothetical protein
MFRALPLFLALSLTITGCARLAESRLNPLNWFGRSTAVAAQPQDLRPLVPAAALVAVTDTRPLIDQITTLSIDRTSDGAIIRATGIATTQGFYNAQLVLVEAQGGTVTYAFRVATPTGFEAIGTAASREVTSATALSAAELAGISVVRVLAATNAREARR